MQQKKSLAGLDELDKLLDTPELPDLGPGPRPVAQRMDLLNPQLDRLLDRTPLPAPTASLIRAAVLLWHDHLDAAHAIVQDIPNPEGSFLHGIMHRREPDYSNAKYWFRRLGTHPCFPQLGDRVRAFLDSPHEQDLRSRLISKGQWDPFAFIDTCEKASRFPAADPQIKVLKEIQKLEFEVLLEYICEQR